MLILKRVHLCVLHGLAPHHNVWRQDVPKQSVQRRFLAPGRIFQAEKDFENS